MCANEESGVFDAHIAFPFSREKPSESQVYIPARELEHP